eukprot:scaffold979_cov221-Pinguiococcus_pyrenoidosus.AAC.1
MATAGEKLLKVTRKELAALEAQLAQLDVTELVRYATLKQLLASATQEPEPTVASATQEPEPTVQKCEEQDLSDLAPERSEDTIDYNPFAVLDEDDGEADESFAEEFAEDLVVQSDKPKVLETVEPPVKIASATTAGPSAHRTPRVHFQVGHAARTSETTKIFTENSDFDNYDSSCSESTPNPRQQKRLYLARNAKRKSRKASTEVENLRRQVELLMKAANLNRQQKSADAPIERSRDKIGPCPHYSGDARFYKTYLFKMRLWFEDAKVTNEQAKIRKAAQHLRGSALAWLESEAEMAGGFHNLQFLDFEDFAERLYVSTAIKHTRYQLLTGLSKVYQGRKTVTEYYSAFVSAAQQIRDLDPTTKATLFVNHLDKDLKERTTSHATFLDLDLADPKAFPVLVQLVRTLAETAHVRSNELCTRRGRRAARDSVRELVSRDRAQLTEDCDTTTRLSFYSHRPSQ